MLSETEIQKIYDEQVKFLEECDTVPMDQWSCERHESFDHAIAIYEVLHKILQIEGKPRWCT